MFETIYNSPIGELLITYDNIYILGLRPDLQQTCTYSENVTIKRCIAQLDEYFDGKRKNFDLPLNPAGTAFQRATWTTLQTIPHGETRTYGQIAALLGNPKASRAVGGANNKNPIYIIIPCHRVIGANGNLVGYGGGLERKIWLLEHEKTIIPQKQK
ncbi:MAG: methylated-DNA--[protein]-cysteine S-methyltransferase [Defluviitaleaceae bacterium]|nr:methylated-DNA--[protein]-cysteine S-methyltransferase [Defluviitaleaceae bacterium]